MFRLEDCPRYPLQHELTHVCLRPMGKIGEVTTYKTSWANNQAYQWGYYLHYGNLQAYQAIANLSATADSTGRIYPYHSPLPSPFVLHMTAKKGLPRVEQRTSSHVLGPYDSPLLAHLSHIWLPKCIHLELNKAPPAMRYSIEILSWAPSCLRSTMKASQPHDLFEPLTMA